jgi:hypothetical protein
MIHVVVVEPLPFGLTEPQPVDQTGVDQFVCQNQISLVGDGRQDTGINHVAAA